MMTSPAPPSPPSPAALVTGGGVRLGRAITLALAGAGYDVVINYRSSEGPAREVAEEVEAMGRRAWTIQGDLTDPATAEALAETTRRGPGRLDLLVNSAATFDPTPLLESDAEAWDAVLEVNTRGPHLLTRACAELLRSSNGSVVNIADHMALAPRVQYGVHAISKAALVDLTRAQALALAPDVRVNAIAPGLVLPPEEMDDEKLDAEISRVPLGRAGSPRDVTDAVLFLASASFITGHLLVVDGGQTLRG